jgi:NAD(P)-dependent dehydrogenase (short-subunit alcohol dehydrogenase family)
MLTDFARRKSAFYLNIGQSKSLAIKCVRSFGPLLDRRPEQIWMCVRGLQRFYSRRNHMDTKNKTILITGASGGLGKALVAEALESGARRVYAAVRKLESPSVWDESRVTVIQLDITDARSVLAAARSASDTDILINNAGSLTRGSLLDLSEADLRRDIDTNFFGTLRMIRAFAPTLATKRETAIVNILSVVALAGMNSWGPYAASKAALLSATQDLRIELKKQNTSVHAVFPGPIETVMTKDVAAPKAKPQTVAKLIFAGIKTGLEDIFPDETAKAIGSQWHKDPKSVERSFASTAL